MTANRPSRLQRFFRFVAFRLIPFILLVAIVLTGYQTAQLLSRRIGEQVEADQRREIYPQTATALAPTITTHTPDADSAAHSGFVLASYHTRRGQSDEPAVVAQFATNTPQADAAPAATATPAA